MNPAKFGKRSIRRKTRGFNPTPEFLESAKEDYYKNGGQIKKQEYVEETWESNMEKELAYIGKYCLRMDFSEIKEPPKKRRRKR